MAPMRGARCDGGRSDAISIASDGGSLVVLRLDLIRFMETVAAQLATVGKVK